MLLRYDDRTLTIVPEGEAERRHLLDVLGPFRGPGESCGEACGDAVELRPDGSVEVRVAPAGWNHDSPLE